MTISTPYLILPFRFIRVTGSEVLLVNEAGEFLFLNPDTFEDFINYRLDTGSECFLNLKGKHFATDTEIAPVIDLLSTKYRTKKGFLRNFTTLHMIVITLRCNHKCRYCQASSEPPENMQWDMSPAVARKVVDIIFQTPSPSVKIEFQGGEPLLNLEAVKEIVEYAKLINKRSQKGLELVICTNLTLIDEETLQFLKKHNILISTTLDGPKYLHDRNRILRNGGSSYDLVIKNLQLAQEILGKDRVSALMTASKDSLYHLRDVVDEYVNRGFRGIFLRAINPFGYAKWNYQLVGYNIEKFIESYKDVLKYIIELNLKGIYFEEFYTSLILSKILTPFHTGFMDFQSPSGAGICGAIYDYNGDVYPCDEGRMLAKMGNKRFLMGNVNEGNFKDIFGGEVLKEITQKSCVEILPGCAECAFQQYCGADPIRNYSEQGDIFGHRPTSEFCKKHTGIIKFLFDLIHDNDQDTMDVFWSWITKRPLERIRCAEFPREAC